ncbi:MAG: peptidoglycan DD-metalloendopeptidase family protein [Propionicimonas sp.]
MMFPRLIPLVLLTSILCLLAPTPARAESGVAPVPGPIVTGFDPPDQPWARGHRGVDLLAEPGTVVVAALPGKISFAGSVAGRPVVVVGHGDTRTTYEPVTTTRPVGDSVAAGDQIGVLQAGHPCAGGDCLHLGWLAGSRYLDPTTLFPTSGLRLLPAEAADVAADLASRRPTTGAGVLLQPVPGRIGSPFGMRLHPIFHTWRMHSGVDIGAGCGTTITAAAAGTVVSRSYDSASGNRLTIDHGVVNGHHVMTHYLHARGYTVAVGTAVRAGQAVGAVGSTGWSTGCHLHFSVWVDGRLVDPQLYL